MNYCTQCGTALDPSAAFCGACGDHVVAGAAAAATTPSRWQPVPTPAGQAGEPAAHVNQNARRGAIPWRTAATATIIGIAGLVFLPFGGLTEREGSLPDYRYEDHYVSLFSDPVSFLVLAPLIGLLTMALVLGFAAKRKAAHGGPPRMEPSFWLSVAAGGLTIGGAIILALVGEEYFSWWLDGGFFIGLAAAVTASIAFGIVNQTASQQSAHRPGEPGPS